MREEDEEERERLLAGGRAGGRRGGLSCAGALRAEDALTNCSMGGVEAKARRQRAWSAARAADRMNASAPPPPPLRTGGAWSSCAAPPGVDAAAARAESTPTANSTASRERMKITTGVRPEPLAAARAAQSLAERKRGRTP